MSGRRYRRNTRTLGGQKSAQEFLEFAQDPTVSSAQLSMLGVTMLTVIPEGFHDKTVGGVRISGKDVRGVVEACVLNPSADVEVWSSISLNCEHSIDQRAMLALSVYSHGFPLALMSGMDDHYLKQVVNSILGTKLRERKDFEYWFDDRMKPWDRRGSRPKNIDLVYAYVYDRDVDRIFDETQRSVLKLFLESTGEDWRKWAR